MIYIASPYSHPDPAVRQRRYEDVCAHVAMRMKAGAVVYSPIAHCHPIAERFGLPGHWEFWERFDRAMIERADGVEVLMLEGWQASAGVTAECLIAGELGIPVTHAEPVKEEAI